MARPVGSEGHDYVHRERVASQYTDSVLNKKRLKLNLGCHFAMLFLLALRVSDLIKYMARKPDDVPAPDTWEELWLLSVIPSVLCLYALSKNHIPAMQLSATLMVLLGCGPLVFGAFSMVEDAMAFFSGNENRVKSLPFFFGFPLVIIRYMFIALCLQIMCLAVFLQTKLIVAWNTRGTKKKN